MSRGEQVALLGTIAWRFPAFVPFVGEHLVDMGGEVLPHLLMADCERWAESLIDNDRPQLARLLALLDEAAGGGGADVVNLVDVSFVENCPTTASRTPRSAICSAPGCEPCSGTSAVERRRS